MCYSAESSIKSFLIGTTSSVYLLTSKDPINKHLGLFFISVCLMQLIEYMMWIDQDCGLINSFASKMVIIVLILQMISVFLGGYLFNTLILNKHLLFYIILILLFGGIYQVYFDFIKDKSKWCSKQSKYNNLIWDKFDIKSEGYHILYYTIFLITPFLFKKNSVKVYITYILGLILFIYSRYNTLNNIGSSSKWCYYSAYIPLLLALYNYFKIKMK